MKVAVNDSCTGCGLCVDACPKVFDLGDDGVAIVLISEVPDEDMAACREAAEGCPVEAIEITE